MGHRLAYAAAETLAAHRTLTAAEVELYDIWSFDPGGATRDLTMPAESDCAGIVLYISNTADAAEVISVENDAAGVICTPTQGEDCVIWCDGTSWYGGVVTGS